jgi:TolB-like protein
MNYLLKSLLVISLFSGCTLWKKPAPEKAVSYETYVLNKARDADYTKPYARVKSIYQNLNGAIVAIADQLLVSNIAKSKNTSIILTSLVNLNNFNKTTTFGKIISESLFNELHVRKFQVTDFRGQDAVSVNAKGEFHLTRNVEKLRDHIEATEYVVVGTYVKFEKDTVLINARIIDSETGAVASTARVIYKTKDCKLFEDSDICQKQKNKLRKVNFGIDIVPEKCNTAECAKK